MNTPLEVARWLADRLDEDGLAYAFGGALALTAWSAPRQTVDVDVMVFVDARDLSRVVDALERAGAIVDRAEAARTTASAGLVIARLSGMRVDVFLATHPVHQEMGQRRRQIDLGTGPLWFISAEDIALLKLFFGRPKDLVDLERLFAAQPDLDLGYIGDWLRRIVPDGDRRLATLDDLVRRFERG